MLLDQSQPCIQDSAQHAHLTCNPDGDVLISLQLSVVFASMLHGRHAEKRNAHGRGQQWKMVLLTMRMMPERDHPNSFHSFVVLVDWQFSNCSMQLV